MRVGSRFVAIVSAIATCALAAPVSAQTGTLGQGMNELVRLYEANSPRLMEVMRHHLTTGTDEVLVNIHLKRGVTAADALPFLTAEGFRLQAISKIDGRVIEGFLPLWAARSASWELGVESVLVSHPAVAEAAVVGRPDELKGQAIAAFVTLESGQAASEELRKALREHVTKEIGAFARPDEIRFTDALPKTRSGKIMRRLLRDIAAGKETLGDTTTLEDYAVLARLREEEE